jgi:co-chaperonin GroES (HSP10)
MAITFIESKPETWGPANVRPKADWVVMLRDPRKTTLSSGLIIPMETNHEKLHEGSGVIIRIGEGPISKAEKLAIGDRLLYRSYLKEISKLPSDEKWPDGEFKEYFLLSLKDVTAVIAKGVELGLLSEKKP